MIYKILVVWLCLIIVILGNSLYKTHQKLKLTQNKLELTERELADTQIKFAIYKNECYEYEKFLQVIDSLERQLKKTSGGK